MTFLKHNSDDVSVCTDQPETYDVGSGPDQWTELSAALKDGQQPADFHLVDDVLEAVPRVLTPAEVVALYTPTEKARIFTSTEPNVLALLLALQFSPGIVVGGTEHAQGTALIAGLGLLDGPERATRILAGEPPE